MNVESLAKLVAHIDENTKLMYWTGQVKGAYNVVVPHDASSLRTDDEPEDKLTLVSIHRFTKDAADLKHEQIFDALIDAHIAADDPVSDYSEVNELSAGGWIHHIITCRVDR